MIREILKMGDPRLLRVAKPVKAFDTPALQALVSDMFDTMRAAQGVGLAAPQIGVDLALVIFGFQDSERYPDAPPVPQTVLLNPQITPLSDDEEDGWTVAVSAAGRRRHNAAAAAAHIGANANAGVSGAPPARGARFRR